MSKINVNEGSYGMSSIGVVVGATYPEELKKRAQRIRDQYKSKTFESLILTLIKLKMVVNIIFLRVNCFVLTKI